MPFDRSGHWFPPTTVHPSQLHAPLPSGHPYDSLVPPFNKQSPGELLDEYYSAKRNKIDWTDPEVLRSYLGEIRKSPRNVGAPTSSEGSVGKSERPSGREAVPVPAYGMGWVLDRPPVVVEFRDRIQEGSSIGVRLMNLFGRHADPARLHGAGDVVLDEMRGCEVEFIIAWPGYQPERFMIRIISENGGPMTRFDLGEQITIAYAAFFRKIEQERLLPSATGFYNIGLYQGQNSRADSGVQLVQLRLVRFRNTIGGRWVADVEIV